MGRRILKFNLKLLTILLIVFAVVVFLGDFSNPRRDIYFRYHGKANPGFIFGYLPNDYYKDYREDTIEDSSSYSLISVKCLKFPSDGHIYILFTDKKDMGSEKILLDSDSIFWHIKGNRHLISSQVNKEVFNKYLKYKVPTSNIETIKNLYFRVIGHFKYENYKVISTQAQIVSLREVDEHSKGDTNECYSYIEKDFDPDFEKYIYLWIDDIGLFEINFVIKGNRLINVEDTFIFGPLSLNVLGTETCK